MCTFGFATLLMLGTCLRIFFDTSSIFALLALTLTLTFFKILPRFHFPPQANPLY